MVHIPGLRRVFRLVVRGPTVEEEVDDEVRFHVETRAAELERQGLAPAAARERARREFGDVERYRRELSSIGHARRRAERRADWLAQLRQDAGYAARALRRAPGWAAVVVLTLAFGVGVNATGFSLLAGVLFRPAPGGPDVVAVYRGGGFFPISYPDYAELRARREVFAELAAWSDRSLALADGGMAEEVAALSVTPHYFRALGVRPALGRFLAEAEGAAGPPPEEPAVVLSHAYWLRRFAGDTAVLGRVVRLNGHPVTIVGVAPEGFTSTLTAYAPRVYVPVGLQNVLRPGGDVFRSHGSQWLHLVGRLRPGVTEAQAEAYLTTLVERLERERPVRDEERRGDEAAAPRPVQLRPVGTLPDQLRLALAGGVAGAMAIPLLVLLITCANVAGMLLARAVARRREVAIRLALGAGRGRLVRQLLTETVLLWMLGGAGGVLVAAGVRGPLLAAASGAMEGPVPILLEAPLDLRVVAFAALLSLGTAVLFGLAPALQSARTDVVAALKDAPGEVGMGGRRLGLRDLLVGAQVAVSVLLIASAGILVQAARRAGAAHPGADPEGVVLAEVDLERLRYDRARARRFFDRLLERTRAIPGVESAALARMVPTGNSNFRTEVGVAGRPLVVDVNVVTPGYLETMRLRLVRGRDFAATDRDGSPPVVLLNETLARGAFPGEDALGQHLDIGVEAAASDTSPPRRRTVAAQVVGIVADGRDRNLDAGTLPHVYFPLAQHATERMMVHARTRARDVAAVRRALRREVEAIDPAVPLTAMPTLRELVDMELLPQRIVAGAAGAFGLLGALLSAIGLYGLVAFAVSRRTREIGVRVALGARRRDVLLLFTRQGLRLAGAGAAVGILLALGVAQVLSAALFGVRALDGLGYLGAAGLMMGAALLASWLPARRAAGVDPVVALRQE